MAAGVKDKLGNDVELNDLVLLDKSTVGDLFGHVIKIVRASNLLLRGNKGGHDQLQQEPGRVKLLIEIDAPYVIQANEHIVGNIVKVVNPNPEHKPASVAKGPNLVS